MTSDPIGIFDSGVGGLSVWRMIVRHVPEAETIYVADQQYLPYGEKSQEQVRERALRITRFLIESGTRVIVVACNSATVSAIGALRQEFPSHTFVGVEPPVKPAAFLTRTGEITILTTTTTARSPRQRRLLQIHANSVRVHLYRAPRFVEIVESGEINAQSVAQEVREFFTRHPIGRSDVLALGCTHYAFLQGCISRALTGIRILDPSDAVARQTARHRLASRTLHGASERHRFYTTGDPEKFRSVAQQLLSRHSLSTDKLVL